MITKPILKKKTKKLLDQSSLKILAAIVVIAGVTAVGLHFLGGSHAATPYVSSEAEGGQLNGNATIVTTDPNASGGKYVQFGSLPGTTTGNSLCGSMENSTPAITKVMIIWEENESSQNILGNSSLPYFNSMAKDCGYTGNYFAYTHPSLPNYLAMTSGISYDSNPWTGDCQASQSGCTTPKTSIFQQMGANWKSYAESEQSPCDTSNSGTADSGATGSSSNIYAARHNPAVYYTNISSTCQTQDVSIPVTNTTSGGNVTNSTPVTNSGALFSDLQTGLEPLTTVTPNLMNDWHDGSASQMDTWLKDWIPVITTGKDYEAGNLAVLVIFDEGNGSGDSQSQTVGVWLSPYTTPGTVSNTLFNDYSVTTTAENLLGLSQLCTSTCDSSMKTAFNL